MVAVNMGFMGPPIATNGERIGGAEVSQPLRRGGKTVGCIGRRAPPLLAGRVVLREARLAPKHEDRTGIGGSLGKTGAASMRNSPVVCSAWLAVACVAISVPAWAQSFRVQCPASTTLHPGERSPAYTGPVTMTGALTADNKAAVNYVSNGGGIKCQQISGGDGYATMADGTVTYLFGFGPLSGLSDLANGGPG